MNYKEEYSKWQSYSSLEPELKKELVAIKDDEEKIKNQFSEYVAFGTAGMRGTMGVGPAMLNIYTIRRATIGIAKFIIKHKKQKDGVAIIYDTRINSKKFATYVANTFSEYGINVYISKDIRPTPFLSYAIREMKTFVGINITASHNRKEDNGYKVYLSDGAQFSSPEDKEIIDLVSKVKDEEIFVDSKSIKPNKKLISFIPKSVEDKFLDLALSTIIHRDFCKKKGKELCVVYTPLHGTGSVFLEEGFKKAGFTNVHIVKSQDDKDGHFKTVAYPNPETKEAFAEALKIAKAKDADIIVATDPDADRLGVYVRIKKGQYVPLTGNELATVIYQYVIYFNKDEYDLTRCMAAKSFVTTRILDVMSENYGIEMKVTPTGFKWIGKEMNKTNKHFLFAAEESYGCIVKDYVRDKDAIGTTLFVLYMALAMKNVGYNIYYILMLIYRKYGIYKSYNSAIEFKGLSGKEQMNNMLNKLATEPFKKLTDINTKYVYNYNDLTRYSFESGVTEKFEFVNNNTIRYVMEDGTVITIRPSGTEPKCRIYFDIMDTSIELADNKYDILSSALKKLLN